MGHRYIFPQIAVAALAVVGVLCAPAMAGVPGTLSFPGDDGRPVTYPVTAEFPANWEGDLRLQVGNRRISASRYRFVEGKDRPILAIEVTNLERPLEQERLLFWGEYRPGHSYRGDLYARNTASKNAVWRKVARFHFGESATGRSGRQVRRDRGAGPDNPCPDGPCWSTGGVGRRAQYYAGGPIQNPGPHRRVAGFNRGTPRSWHWEAQQAAQWVGIERARMLQRYTRPYFPFFWGYFFSLR